MTDSPLAPFIEKHSTKNFTSSDAIKSGWEAVRNEVGFLDLSFKKKILVRGQDRVSFLHRMLTQDIQNLKAGDAVLSCLLTPKGKIISDAVIYSFKDFLFLQLGSDKIEDILQHLSRFILMDDVILNDASQTWGILSVQGPKSGLIKHCLSEKWTPFPYSRTGEIGFEWVFPIEQAEDLFNSLRIFSPLPWIGSEAQEVLRIEAGIPIFGSELGEEIIPNEADLENAVSFTKGCYPGQEIVARIKYRGGVQKKLSGIELDGASLPHKNDPIYRGDLNIGFITSACYSPCLKKNIAMAYLKTAEHKKGIAVNIQSQNTLISATIQKLPFYSSAPESHE